MLCYLSLGHVPQYFPLFSGVTEQVHVVKQSTLLSCGFAVERLYNPEPQSKLYATLSVLLDGLIENSIHVPLIEFSCPHSWLCLA